MNQFIWGKDCIRKNTTLAFCKTFEYEGQVSLRIAAGNIYRVFVNGNLTGYGPARAAAGHSRTDEYTFLCTGKTHVVIEVCYYGVNSFYVVCEDPFLCCRMQVGEILFRAEDFTCREMIDRVRKVQRLSFQRPFVEIYDFKFLREKFYLGEFELYPEVRTECVPARILSKRNVGYPDFDRTEGTRIEKGFVAIEPTRPKWQHRSFTQIGQTIQGFPPEEMEERLSDEVSAFVATARNSSLRYELFDLSRAVTGFFEVGFEATQVGEAFLLFDEIRSESRTEGIAGVSCFRNQCCQVLKFRLCKGVHRFLSFEPYSARYMAIVLTKNVSVSYANMLTYENPDVRFSFRLPDKGMNRIIQAAVNTFRHNSVDVLTDCPSRERAGWLCDSFFTSSVERLLTGQSRVEQNFLENYLEFDNARGELPEGMLPMCYPADHPEKVFIPNWAMWFVLELKQYFDATGDGTLVEKARDKVFGLIHYFESFENEDGLLENLKGWVFVEWSQANKFTNGVNFPTNMLYAKMLESAAVLYGEEKLREKAQRLKQTIFHQSYNGMFFCDNAVRIDGKVTRTENTTETCQYYAFYFDIATPKNCPALFDFLFQPCEDMRLSGKLFPSNAFIGNYLRLDYLFRLRRTEQILKECRDFFGYMADRTLTLWEYDRPDASCDHGFASYVLKWILYAYIGLAGERNGELLFEENVLGEDCDFWIPIENKIYHVEVKDGVRTILAKN